MRPGVLVPLHPDERRRVAYALSAPAAAAAGGGGAYGAGGGEPVARGHVLLLNSDVREGGPGVVHGAAALTARSRELSGAWVRAARDIASRGVRLVLVRGDVAAAFGDACEAAGVAAVGGVPLAILQASVGSRARARGTRGALAIHTCACSAAAQALSSSCRVDIVECLSDAEAPTEGGGGIGGGGGGALPVVASLVHCGWVAREEDIVVPVGAVDDSHASRHALSVVPAWPPSGDDGRGAGARGAAAATSAVGIGEGALGRCECVSVALSSPTVAGTRACCKE